MINGIVAGKLFTGNSNNTTTQHRQQQHHQQQQQQHHYCDLKITFKKVTFSQVINQVSFSDLDSKLSSNKSALFPDKMNNYYFHVENCFFLQNICLSFPSKKRSFFLPHLKVIPRKRARVNPIEVILS